MWMKIILNDLSMKYDVPMKLFLDNKLAITISQNIVLDYRTKHIEIDWNLIMERFVDL